MKQHSLYSGLLFIFLTSFILSACRKEESAGCFKSVGSQTEVLRKLQPFSALHITDKIDVVLHQDSTRDFTAILSGGKNLLPGIITRVKDDTLYIDDGNSCNWVRDMQNRTRIDLYIRDLSKIEMHGLSTLGMEKRIYLGDVQVDFISSANQEWDLWTNKLTLNHSGIGDIKISGRSAVYVLTMYFVSGADARNMVADYAFVYSYTTANAWVQPIKGLGVFIYDTGNVYYTREPWEHIVFEKNGPGERIYAPPG